MRSWLAALNEAPRLTKIAVKPAMKATEWSSTRPRVPASTSLASRSTDMPVMNERYEGNSGNTQGDRNESRPAENATSTPIDSVIRVSSFQQRLEEGLGGRAAPLARSVREERAISLPADDERRRHRPHTVGPGHRHLGIERHRKRQAVPLQKRVH